MNGNMTKHSQLRSKIVSALLVLLLVLVGLLSGVIVGPSQVFAQAPRQTATPSSEQLKEDIRYLRQFMREYEIAIQTIESDYGAWGFTVDTDGLEVLNQIIRNAQAAWFRQDYNEVVRLLEQWEDAFQKYDASVTDALQKAEFRYLTEDLIPKFVPEIDSWLEEKKEAGYEIKDEFIKEWEGLKKELPIIRKLWDTDPAKAHEQYEAWWSKYYDWEERLEDELDEQDEEGDDEEEFKKALKEWLDLAKAYFEAEGKDIGRAAKDGLPGAQDDLDFLESERPLLTKAQQAFQNGKLQKTNRLLSKLELELFEPWSDGAQVWQEQFKEWGEEFAEWLKQVRSRIDELAKKGVDVRELEDEFKVTKQTVEEARAAASRFCSTYLECGEKLNEYDGYLAHDLYNELEGWWDWWEEVLNDYKVGDEEKLPTPEE